MFARLDPAALRRGFLAWVEAVAAAIDGKMVRRSFDTAAGRGPLHLIRARAAENRLVRAQVAVDGHSNEITAIPELLALLDRTGAIVTLDAMGCQKAVVEAIRNRGGDYVIPVKGNQPGRDDAVGPFFRDAVDRDFAGIPHRYQRTTGRGHGRVETRHYDIVAAPEAVRAQPSWQAGVERRSPGQYR